MNIKIFNKLNLLNDKIKYHNLKYHTQDNPEITDFEFDKLCEQYDDIILSNPEFNFLERKSVGGEINNQFQKHQHKKPMASLVNAFSFDDINDFINRTYKFLSLKKDLLLEFTCEPKIDGLSISLLYLNGNLLNVEGPLGKKSLNIDVSMFDLVINEGKSVSIKPKSINQDTKRLWGMHRSLLNNAIIGTSSGYSKILELKLIL